MNINADFTKRAVVHAARIDWLASPMAGVERRMLDRIGDEVARATTIVRYAPGSHFSPHVHTGGEEFLVLEGVFQDEHGDFPSGSYVRNPPTTSHTPGSERGCTILVKLSQFDPDDRHQVRIDSAEVRPEIDAKRPGVALLALHHDANEEVRMEFWQPGAEVEISDHRGLELLVIEGGFRDATEGFEKHSWLRLPPGMPLTATAGAEGAQVWLKCGHLETPLGLKISA